MSNYFKNIGLALTFSPNAIAAVFSFAQSLQADHLFAITTNFNRHLIIRYNFQKNKLIKYLTVNLNLLTGILL